jgi:hypothetical protein
MFLFVFLSFCLFVFLSFCLFFFFFSFFCHGLSAKQKSTRTLQCSLCRLDCSFLVPHLSFISHFVSVRSISFRLGLFFLKNGGNYGETSLLHPSDASVVSNPTLSHDGKIRYTYACSTSNGILCVTQKEDATVNMRPIANFDEWDDNSRLLFMKMIIKVGRGCNNSILRVRVGVRVRVKVGVRVRVRVGVRVRG